jgi:hypothetical protein
MDYSSLEKHSKIKYYTNEERPELFGLEYMPLLAWKSRNEGKYFYKIYYKNVTPIDYISKKIIKLAKKNENFYIFLNDSLEGYACLNFDIVNDFVKTHQLENKVIYATGHLDVYQEYEIWIKNKNFNKNFFVYPHNRWFWSSHDFIKQKKIAISLDKSIWYCCMNNRPRDHRLTAITYLDFLKMLKYGIVSANDRDYEFNALFNYEDIISTNLNLLDKDYVSKIQLQKHITKKKLPLVADVSILSKKCLPNDISVSVYDKTLINLVTETYYFNNLNKFSEMFISEKSWKPFIAKQIPIIIGPRGIVSRIRNFGFDMFDDIVDHSYDDEPDSTRLFSAVNSLNRVINDFNITDISNLTRKRRKKNFKKMLAGIDLDKPIWKAIDVY